MAALIEVQERRHVYFRGSCTVKQGNDTITIKLPAKVPAGKRVVMKVDVHGVLIDNPPEPPPEPE